MDVKFHNDFAVKLMLLETAKQLWSMSHTD